MAVDIKFPIEVKMNCSVNKFVVKEDISILYRKR